MNKCYKTIVQSHLDIDGLSGTVSGDFNFRLLILTQFCEQNKVLSYVTKEFRFGEMLESEARMKLFDEKKPE